MGISITQLVIVLVIVLVLFGTKRLRNMGGYQTNTQSNRTIVHTKVVPNRPTI